jgi:hypothetical protein
MIAPPKPPSHDDAEALIKEARARQLRRRLLGAAGVAIAAAVGLGVYAFVNGGGPANLVQPPAQRRSATDSRCSPSQLAATLGFQGATQTLVGGADIKNTGSRACSLPAGWPRVRVTADGRQRAVQQSRPPRTARGTPAGVLAPGHAAVVEMQWANWCGTKAPFKAVFSIRLGVGLVVRAATVGGPPCLAPFSPSTLIVDRPRIDG